MKDGDGVDRLPREPWVLFLHRQVWECGKVSPHQGKLVVDFIENLGLQFIFSIDPLISFFEITLIILLYSLHR